MTMLCLATTARMSRRGFAFFLDLDMVASRGLLGRNQTELKGLGSHVRQNSVSGVAVVVETI